MSGKKVWLWAVEKVPCRHISSCGTHWDYHLSSKVSDRAKACWRSDRWIPLNFCLEVKTSQLKGNVYLLGQGTNLILANSLLILFSSSSRALAFLRSAINCTNPRIFELFPELPRPKNPDAAEDAMMESRSRLLVPDLIRALDRYINQSPSLNNPIQSRSYCLGRLDYRISSRRVIQLGTNGLGETDG